MTQPVYTATLNKHKYNIYLGPLAGVTINSRSCAFEIMVRTSQMSEYQILASLCHEIEHAQNPTKSEKRVDTHSKELARLLWRLGYRRFVQYVKPTEKP